MSSLFAALAYEFMVTESDQQCQQNHTVLSCINSHSQRPEDSECCPASLYRFLSVHSPVLRLFHTFLFLLTHPTPLPPFSLSADDLASYFPDKTGAMRRELPQTPTTSSTHLRPSALYSAFLLLLKTSSMLLSRARPIPPLCN